MEKEVYKMKIQKIVFHALAGIAAIGGIYNAVREGGSTDSSAIMMLWAILFEIVNLNIKEE